MVRSKTMKTQHLLSRGQLCTELGLSIRLLNKVLDQLGREPAITLNRVAYFPDRTIKNIAKHLDGIDRHRKPLSKRNAGAP